ncbi:MAG: choice-of-anchor B family protein [Actinophytocola sp.]|nr:choice-of-anchor B family protein [Actinophytocola sp.]
MPASQAATPEEGTVSLDQRTVSWEGHHYAIGSTAFADTVCPGSPNEVCDHFTLNVDVDPAHWENYRGGAEVSIGWQDPADDFDVHVFDADGNHVGHSISENSTEETVLISKPSGTYDVYVNPFNVSDSGYDGRAELHSRRGAVSEVPDEPLYDVPCQGGAAGPFPCRGVDLAAFLPLSSVGSPTAANDIWGWTDPQTGREYALLGTTSGTAFVDVTTPTSPEYLGMLPSHQPVETLFASWRDVKVYQNHAYVVSEEPLHGMQVFDLTRLRGATEPQQWTEDAHYPLVGGAHNVAINTDTGFAYILGSLTCDGGPHMVDISEPTSPQFAGCVSEDGYTHDTQAVTYDGPDSRFTGHEILFNSNEDTVTIVDVTDKSNPVQLARFGYENASYTHQGWLTEDSRTFLFNDEADETDHGVNTTTYILDVTSLTDPKLRGTYVADTPAIDHNLYTKGDTVYEANYRSGLRILDGKRVERGTLRETAFFDVYPADDAAEFNGAWSNYPYFESGTVVVSGIEQGLFVLQPRK